MRSLVHQIAGGYPGVTLDHNFGPDIDSWKVGGKIFAIAEPSGVSVKCADPEMAAMLIEDGRAEPAPYLRRGGWIRLSRDALDRGVIDAADVAHRIGVSYDTIRAALPKRLRPGPPDGNGA
jgi:predicted DNA-binding protein (MmcQ/YjbR family)